MGSHKLRYYRRWLRIYVNKWLGREYVESVRYPTIEISGSCNLNCVFCAYKEKDEGKVVMSNDDFAGYIDQLVAMGYHEFGLTPQTGDVFMDKYLSDKIDILERHPGVEAYEFITNLVGASEATLARLARAEKLTRMYISLYGHDEAGFQSITNRPAHQYRRLVDNIETLSRLGPGFQATIGSFVMTDRDMDWSPLVPYHGAESDLMAAMRDLAQNARDFCWTGNHVDFDSWGGRITQRDLDALDKGFKVVGPTVPMTGPCGMLFGGFVILADGRVNACACRAVGNGLLIGDAKTAALKDVLSPDNPAYAEILQQHKRSRYPAACQNCKIFNSIYRRPHKRATMTVASYLEAQRKRCASPRH